MRTIRIFIFAAAAAVILCSFLIQSRRYDSVYQQLNKEQSVILWGDVRCVSPQKSMIRCDLAHTRIRLPGGKEISAGSGVVYCGKKGIRSGDRMIFRGRISVLEDAVNDGGFSDRQYYRSLNIRYRIFADDAAVIKKNRVSVFRIRDRIRSMLHEQIGLGMAEPYAGILRAMLLADRNGLDAMVRQSYQTHGIAHILAISGLHISLAGMGVFKVLKKLRCPLYAACMISSGCVLAYAMISCWPLSAKRAVIMYLVYIGANMLGRTNEPAVSCAIAAGIILMIWPLSAANTGFLLSFGSIVSIVCLMPYAQQVKAILFRHFRFQNAVTDTAIEGFLLSAVLFVGILPLNALFFYQVPVAALLLNPLIVPLCPLLLGMGFAGCVFAGFIPAAGRGAFFICTLILKLFEGAMGVSDALPGMVRITGAPPVWMAVSAFVLMVMLPVCSFYSRKRTLSRVRILAVRAVVVCFICLNGMVFFGIRQTGFCTADFLDVGQGDAICIRSETNKVIFIDGGSSTDKNPGIRILLPYLKYHGIGQVDYWIITHTDADHCNGALEVLKSGYPVKTMIFAKAAPKDKLYVQLAKAAKKNRTLIAYAMQDSRISMEDLTLTCLYPRAEEEADDMNDLSQVWLADCSKSRLLLTGDAGEEAEKRMEQRGLLCDIDILKAGHHGSRKSTGAAFLKKVCPEAAIILAGENNRYGHPHEDTLLRLADAGAKVFDTRESGQIRIRFRNGYKIFAHRPCQ